jgi:HEAT repeat protein
VGVLLAALIDSDTTVRAWAATALGRIGSVRALGPLRAALNDADESVRTKAQEAIDAIGAPPELPESSE